MSQICLSELGILFEHIAGLKCSRPLNFLILPFIANQRLRLIPNFIPPTQINVNGCSVRGDETYIEVDLPEGIEMIEQGEPILCTYLLLPCIGCSLSKGCQRLVKVTIPA